MRLMFSLCLIVGPASLVAAHTLASDASGQIAHHFLSLHHLPPMLLLLAALAVLLGRGIAARRD